MLKSVGYFGWKNYTYKVFETLQEIVIYIAKLNLQGFANLVGF